LAWWMKSWDASIFYILRVCATSSKFLRRFDIREIEYYCLLFHGSRSIVCFTSASSCICFFM
jgi:hypothetical protein